MTPRTRTITGTALRADLSPWANVPVTLYLRDGGTDGEVTFPPGGISTDTSELGAWAFEDTWCNEEGLERSEYLLVEPGNRTVEFTLPYEDGSPITIEELEARGIIPDWATSWTGNALTSFMANLASMVNRALGSNLVGWLAAGVGAVGKTVRDKLDERITTADYTTFAQAVTAAAGRTLVVNSAITTGTTTVPSTVTLRFDRNGSITVSGGGVLTIDGAIEAGRHQIFAGAGTVTGTPILKDGAYPQWFGAVGDDETDDTAALQLTADFHTFLNGGYDHWYVLKTDGTLWLDRNLHREKSITGNPEAGWANGMWRGVALQDGAKVRGRFSLSRTTDPVTAARGTFAFAAGRPDYGERLESVDMSECEFKVQADAEADVGERYKTLLVQSVKNVKYDNNTLIGRGEHYPIVGTYMFDVGSSTTNNNYCEGVFTLTVQQYSSNGHISGNRLVNSRQLHDLDAWNDTYTVSGNTFDRDEWETNPDDGVYEFNGTKNVKFYGNVSRMGHTGVIISNKKNLFDTWEGVMTQDQDLGVSTCLWQNIECTSNTFVDFTHQPYVVGSNWNSTPHEGELIGEHLLIHDTIVDCGHALGVSDEHALVRVYEGRDVDVRCAISNPSRIITRLDAAAALGATALTLDSVEGVAVGDWISILLDTNANRTHTKARIIDINGSVVETDNPLDYAAGSTNKVWIGPGDAKGIYARSWVDADVVDQVETTINAPGEAGHDFIIVESAAGLSPGSGLVIDLNDPELDILETSSISINGTTVYIADPLPGDVSVGNAVVQASAEGADEASTMIVTIGGSISDTGRAAIDLSRVERAQFVRPVIRNCGANALGNDRRQVFLNRLEARTALVTGSLDIKATLSEIKYGIGVYAETMAAAAWSVRLSDSVITGHALYDLYLGDSSAELENITNLSIVDSDIPLTNINLSLALSYRPVGEMWATTYPTDGSGRNAAFPVGFRIWNTAAAIGSPIGWVCTVAGAPGTWAPLGIVQVQADKVGGWAPGAIASAAAAVTNVTVPTLPSTNLPARAGFSALSGTADDWELTAFVQSTTNVRVMLRRRTSGTVDPGSGTLSVTVG